MTQLRRKEKKFEDQGVQVVLVGMGTIEPSEAFRREFKFNFPLVCDPGRRLYAAYDLKKMSFFQLASPSLWSKGLKALSQGHSPGMPQGDIYQLPGVFIIDCSGYIRFGHYSRDPADHPTAGQILFAVEKMMKV